MTRLLFLRVTPPISRPFTPPAMANPEHSENRGRLAESKNLVFSDFFDERSSNGDGFPNMFRTVSRNRQNDG